MEDEVELAVGQGTIALDVVVVAYPVAATDIADGREEVGHLVDIDKLLELFVGLGRGTVLCELPPAVESVPGPCHLEVAVGVLEGVHLVVIVAIVGIAMIAVVGFAQVELCQVFSVEEDMDGLVVLAVAVEAAGLEHLLGDGIADATMSH